MSDPQVDAALRACQNSNIYLDQAIATLSSYTPPLVDCYYLAFGRPGKSARWLSTLALSNGRTAGYYIKGANGYPYDIKIFDFLGLREHSTENEKIAWTDPAAASAWKSYNLPLYFLPRFYDPSWGEIVLSNLADLPWTRYWTCTQADPVSHLGPTKTTFSGPFTDRDWSGDIGKSPYFLTHYYYGSVRENFYWSDPYAWFGWEHQSQVNGVWTTDKSSIHNTVAVNPPVVQDPCGIVNKVFF